MTDIIWFPSDIRLTFGYPCIAAHFFITPDEETLL